MTGQERLDKSREMLRQALKPSIHPALAPLAATDPVSAALTQWWEQQSWVTGLRTLKAAGNSVMRPLAREHPYGMMIGAFVLGAVAVRTVFGRGLLRPGHLIAWASPWILGKLASQAPLPWAATIDALLQVAPKANTPKAAQTTPASADSKGESATGIV